MRRYATRPILLTLPGVEKAGLNSCRRYASKILIQRVIYAIEAKEVSNQSASLSFDDSPLRADLWTVECGPVRRYHGPGRYHLQTRLFTGKEIYSRVDERRSSALRL